MNLKDQLRHVYNHPKEGVDFIDITTVLKDADAFQETIQQMKDTVKDCPIDVIVGSESRGFIMGAPLAFAMNKGFVPVRKKGKLPYETIQVNYSLEYGEDQLEMHIDAIQPGQNVLIVDDLLATGGTALATCKLVESLGGNVAGLLFFIELETEFKGREVLKDYRVDTLVQF